MTSGRPGRIPKVALAILVLLLVPAAMQPFAEAAHPRVSGVLDERVTYEWWDEKWHLRVPVLVKPELQDPFKPEWTADIAGPETYGYPVTLEMDFTSAVLTAGEGTERQWPRDNLGRLSSFTFDTESVRVVAYSRDTGKIDRAQGVSGVMPHLFFPSYLENPERRNGVFNASSNAIGTIVWIAGQTPRLPGLPFTEARLYYVYFDVTQNGKKEPAVFSDAMMGPLKSMWWIRQGTTFYGYAPAHEKMQSGYQPRLEIYGIHDNTTIAVYRYRFSGFTPDLVPHCKDVNDQFPCVDGPAVTRKHPSGLPIIDGMMTDGGTFRAYVDIADSNPFFFKVESSKPVFVVLREQTESGSSTPLLGTIYPSLDAGPVGTQFRIAPVSGMREVSNAYEKNGLTVITFTESARVTFSGRGAQECGFAVTIPARSVHICNRDYNTGGNVVSGAPIQITSTTPIAVMQGGFSMQFGVPAVDRYGSPVGNDLVTLASRSFMAIPYSDSEVRVSYIADTTDSYPPGGRTMRLREGALNAWSEDMVNKHAFESRAYTFDARSGQIAGQGGTRGLIQPGGEYGMRYELALWIDSPFAQQAKPYAMVISPYDNTQVEILDYKTGQTVRRTMNADDFFVRRPGEPEPFMQAAQALNGYRVTASKPVFTTIYGREDPYMGGYYQGIARPPVMEIGEAEFHGALVGFKVKVLTSTFKPGDEARFTFTIENLGRGVGGADFVDTINLRTRIVNAPEEWTPEPQLSEALIPDLGTGDEREVTLAVKIPDTAQTGDAVEIEIEARSGKNPNMRDLARAQITIQTKYEFTMKFRDGGRTSLTRILEPGLTSSFEIEIENTGTGDDEVMLHHLPDRFCFKSELLDPQGRSLIDSQGRGIRPLPLAVNERKIVNLRITPPDDAAAVCPPYEAPVEGVSLTDSSVRSLVVATVLVNVETNLRILLEEPEILVVPGSTATLPVRIQNEGVETEVVLTLEGALPDGWNVSVTPDRLTLRGPGTRDEATGQRQDIGFVNVTVTAGDPAPVGMVVPAKLTATPGVIGIEGVIQGTSELITSRVVNNFTLLLNDDLFFERPANPGDAIAYNFDFRSIANGPMDVFIIAANLSAGWRLEYDAGTRRIEAGDEGQLRATLHVRPNEAAGTYPATLGFVLTDEDNRREIREVDVSVRVRRVLDYEVTWDRDLLVEPGASAPASLAFTNTGNGLLQASLDFVAPDGWRATFLDAREASFEIPPGAVHRVNVSLHAPEDALEDDVVFRIVGTIPGSDFPDNRKVTDVPASILRRDLELRKVTLIPERAALREGSPVVIVAEVLNNGTVPAYDVQVALLVDGKDVQSVTLGALRPRELVNATFSWNVIRGQSISVMVDPFDRIPESDVANNAIRVSFDDIASVNLPAAPVFLFLASLGAAAVAVRSRRREP